MAKQDHETYRDQAGRRHRRHLASPEERDARDAEAPRLRVAGPRYREIAPQRRAVAVRSAYLVRVARADVGSREALGQPLLQGRNFTMGDVGEDRSA